MGRNNKPTMVMWHGREVKLTDLCRMYGQSIRTVKWRIFNMHWPLEKALITRPGYYRGPGPTMVQWQGKEVPLCDLARAHGRHTKTVKNRMKAGMTLEAALKCEVLGAKKKADCRCRQPLNCKRLPKNHHERIN